MKKLFFALIAIMVVAGIAPTYAADKTKTAYQADLETYKLDQFNAEREYDELIDLSDSIAFDDTFGVDLDTNCIKKMHNVTVTQAEVNAGHILFSSASGSNIYIDDVIMYSSGSTNDWTSVVLENDDGADVISYTSAATQNGVFTDMNEAAATQSVGLVDGLGASKGLLIGKTGADGAGTADLKMNISYCVQ